MAALITMRCRMHSSDFESRQSDGILVVLICIRMHSSDFESRQSLGWRNSRHLARMHSSDFESRQSSDLLLSTQFYRMHSSDFESRQSQAMVCPLPLQRMHSSDFESRQSSKPRHRVRGLGDEAVVSLRFISNPLFPIAGATTHVHNSDDLQFVSSDAENQGIGKDIETALA